MLLLLALSAAADFSEQIRQEVARQECGGTANGDEVVVCARRRDKDRYRLREGDVEVDPQHSPASVARERSKWIQGGDAGTNSCSATGPGGWTGCMLNRWKTNRQQQKGLYGF